MARLRAGLEYRENMEGKQSQNKLDTKTQLGCGRSTWKSGLSFLIQINTQFVKVIHLKTTFPFSLQAQLTNILVKILVKM